MHCRIPLTLCIPLIQSERQDPIPDHALPRHSTYTRKPFNLRRRPSRSRAFCSRRHAATPVYLSEAEAQATHAASGEPLNAMMMPSGLRGYGHDYSTPVKADLMTQTVLTQKPRPFFTCRGRPEPSKAWGKVSTPSTPGPWRARARSLVTYCTTTATPEAA